MTGFATLLARELRHYFVTPIACVVIAVFWAASGFFFSFNALFVSAPDMVSAFHNMSLLLLLMMPLVSMRTLAEERQGGTLELLLTLPLSETTVVLAKYVALLVILGLMLAGSAVSVIPLALYSAPDYGPILGGYIGVFLLAAAFAAIGLAASSCAANQVVAAILTWFLLLALWFIDYAAALDGAGGAARWLAHVSFSVQYLDLIRGVLSRGAVIYFGSIIVIGVVVAAQVLRARRSTTLARGRSALLPVAAIVTFAAASNLWVLNHPARIDLTSAGVYSIGPETRRVLDTLEQPVTITFFYDLRSRAMQDARYLLEQYAARSALVAVESHDPTLEPAVAAREGISFAGTTVFRSGDRRIAVNGADEVTFTNALIRVSSDAAGHICFTDGHVESNPMSLQAHDHYEGNQDTQDHSHASGGAPLTLHERHGMGMARNALETLGFKVEQRLLLAGPDALDGCRLVIVASPQQAFQPREAALLGRAARFANPAAAGGQPATEPGTGIPVILLLEPGVESGLESLLGQVGISVSGDMIRDPARHYWTDPATPAVSDYPRHRVTRRLALTFFPGATALEPAAGGLPADIRVVPLAETSPDSVLASAPDDPPRSRTLALLARSKTRGLSIAVVGDGDFATNSFFGALGNGQLLLNLVGELTDQQRLLDIAPREYAFGELRMTNAQLRATFLLTTVVGPAALLLITGWMGWRRR